MIVERSNVFFFFIFDLRVCVRAHAAGMAGKGRSQERAGGLGPEVHTLCSSTGRLGGVHKKELVTSGSESGPHGRPFPEDSEQLKCDFMKSLYVYDNMICMDSILCTIKIASKRNVCIQIERNS